MATYYAVGATYDGVTNSLATSTGGSATVAVVTAADTIILDLHSLTMAFTADPACAVINIQAAYLHTCTFSHAISAGAITMASTAGTLTTGGNTVTVKGTSGTVWTYSAGTIDTVSLVVSDTGASSKTLALGTGSYNLSVTSGGAGAVILNGTTVTFTGFAVTGATTKTIDFQASQTFNFTGSVTFNTGALVTLASTSPGTAATITLSAGWNTNYVSVQDLNASGYDAPGILGANGVIGTNATGWVITDSPIAIPILPSAIPGAAQFAALVGKAVG